MRGRVEAFVFRIDETVTKHEPSLRNSDVREGWTRNGGWLRQEHRIVHPTRETVALCPRRESCFRLPSLGSTVHTSAMAFSPREPTWSQGGYVGTTFRNDDKDDAPGSSPEKTTLLIGNGYIFDRAELARIEARERGPNDKAPSGTKATVQGEERARASKRAPVAFDGRTPRRKPPAPPKPAIKAKVELERSKQAPGGTHHDGSERGEDQYYDHKTRGYTNTGKGWPHSSRPFLSKGVIDREPERLKRLPYGATKRDKSDKQYWDNSTRGFTNTGKGWPCSSRPFLSKGIIDREPERLKRLPYGATKRDQTDGQYWDHNTRGYTNTGKGWPCSSRPFLSKDIIYRV